MDCRNYCGADRRAASEAGLGELSNRERLRCSSADCFHYSSVVQCCYERARTDRHKAAVHLRLDVEKAAILPLCYIQSGW